jgi:hypothetical protein
VTPASLIDRTGPLSGTAHYLHWGPIQISVTNFVIIVLMVLLFIAALLIPFPHGHDDGSDLPGQEPSDDE